MDDDPHSLPLTSEWNDLQYLEADDRGVAVLDTTSVYVLGGPVSNGVGDGGREQILTILGSSNLTPASVFPTVPGGRQGPGGL